MRLELINFQTTHDNDDSILNTKNFAYFMRDQGKNYDKFMESVELAKKAIFNNVICEILKEKAIKGIKVIINDQNQLDHSTKEFKEFLKYKN